MANAYMINNYTADSSLPATLSSRPTSKDYGAEIQRLELERMKLQTQPISFPVHVAMNNHIPVSQSSKKQKESPDHVTNGVPLLASRSAPELRINLETVKADMQQDKEVVNSIQNQLSHRSEELSSRNDLADLSILPTDLNSGDVSEEQRMIATLRKQLNQQARENAILKHQLPITKSVIPSPSSRASTDDTVSPMVTNSLPVVMSPQLTQVIPSSITAHTRAQTSASYASLSSSSSPSAEGRTPLLRSPKSSFTHSTKPPANCDSQRCAIPDKSTEIHLERKLVQSQTQVTQLKDRLKECNNICEQQKFNFHESLVELGNKLKETIVGRDSVLDLRRKEADGQERLIDQLQKTLKELDTDYRLQQQDSRDLNLKIESLQQNLSTTTAALDQVNLLVTQESNDRGLTSLAITSQCLANQRPALAVTSLQQLLKHYQDELKEVRHRSENCGKELEDLRREFNDHKLKIAEEHRCKQNALSEEHEKQMNTMTERALNARQQATYLQAQLTVLQAQLHEQIGTKSKHVSDMEQTIVAMQEQMSESRKILEGKCQSLGDELDDLTNHHRTVSKEKDELVSSVEDLKKQLANTKESLAKSKACLDAERVQNKHLQEQEEEETITKFNNLNIQLDRKTLDIEQLKRLLVDARVEASKVMEEKISAVEIQERQRSSELACQLSAQVATLTQKCTVLSQELDQKENLLHSVKKQQEDTLRTAEDKKHQLQITLAEKTESTKLIEEKDRNLEIITQERDQYFALLENRNKEINSLCSQQENLLLQISENEQQVMVLQEQNKTLINSVEMSSKSNNDVKEESIKLQHRLEEWKSEAERLNVAVEDTERSIKMKDRKLEELKMENRNLVEEVEVKMREIEGVIESKEKMLTELRETKLEVDAIAKDNERLRLNAIQSRRQYDMDRNKLASKLRVVQHELTVTANAIQIATTVDAKAVHVAETMQKKVTAKRGQIDSLQSKIHWLEECLEASLKEKSTIIGEKDKLQLMLGKLSRHNQRLNADINTMLHKKKAQKRAIRKLQTSLKKAAMKHSEVQACVEMQEQDMTRLRLKHQLEIKELQRSYAMQSGSRPNSFVTKLHNPVLGRASAPFVPPVPVAKETKTQTVQTDAGTVASKSLFKESAKKEYSLSQLFTQESSNPSNDINQELKTLLSEMRSVLTTAADTVKQQSPLLSTPSRIPLSTSSRNPTLPSSSINSKEPNPPIYSSSPYKDLILSITPPTSDVPRTIGKLTAYNNDKLTIDGPPSPVAYLLGRYDVYEPKDEPEQDGKNGEANSFIPISSVKMASKHRPKRTGHRRVSVGSDGEMKEIASEDKITSVTSAANHDLNVSMQTQHHHIKDLEEQLKVLTKIGGQLQQENQELLINSKNVKLKRCRKEKATKSVVSVAKH